MPVASLFAKSDEEALSKLIRQAVAEGKVGKVKPGSALPLSAGVGGL